ncbi:MAG: DUF3489 domain-containing protein [Alphaproteobacteria bacterium]|nr:MAG: DUF3489 domain-containing protein [Alphaproteobacteria bacterium]
MPKKPSKSKPKPTTKNKVKAAIKTKAQGNGHPIDESKLSTPMQAALAGVAAMPVKRETKLTALVVLLSRPEGANIEDMIAATGWQKHTIRSALSHALAKKHGYQIVSEKSENGARIYKITGRAQ